MKKERKQSMTKKERKWNMMKATKREKQRKINSEVIPFFKSNVTYFL